MLDLSVSKTAGRQAIIHQLRDSSVFLADALGTAWLPSSSGRLIENQGGFLQLFDSAAFIFSWDTSWARVYDEFHTATV